MRVVVLDAGPLNLASQPRGKPDADRCRTWLLALDAAGVRVVVPEVAAYEVRRKLLHIGATAGIARLDRLAVDLAYEPITTAVMRLAAEY
jgi:predicted nucleic acid-binding protein